MEMKRSLVGLAAAVVLAACGSSDNVDGPIPLGGQTDLPSFIGEASLLSSLPALNSPQNPAMASNPYNNVHNDSWMSDVYDIGGPIGRQPRVLSSTLMSARRSSQSPGFVCGTITFDQRGRLVATCVGPREATLVLLDPDTLAVLSYLWLPVPTDAVKGYGTGYMYLDKQDRAVVNLSGHVWVVAQAGIPESPRLEVVKDYDLTTLVGDDSVQAVVPDWQGRLWFVVRKSGMVGVIDPATDRIESVTLGEEIGNSLTVSADATYVVTTKALYRLEAGTDGVPKQIWREAYQNIGMTKPGQLTPGSGTTPTILDEGRYIAITDNADPMNVVVYRTAAGLGAGIDRKVCEKAVFKAGASATEDSLVGYGRSLIVANQYGYRVDWSHLPGTKTESGVTRIDIAADGSGCIEAWTNDAVAVPQVGPKMSTKTGLVYFFTRQYDTKRLDVYYWTAVDFRTGKTVWERQVGTGGLFDSYVPGPAIGPGGTLYVGTYGGVVALRDGS